MITGQDIVDVARGMIGTPFVHMGRKPGVELDCAGVVVAIGDWLGMRYDDLPTYSTGSMIMLEIFDRYLVRRDAAERAPGLILAWRIRKRMHCAIQSTGGRIIHALLEEGKVVEHKPDPKWMRRLLCVHAFPGVEY